MGTEDNSDRRFQHRDGDGLLNGPSSSPNPFSNKVSGMTVGTSSMYKADPFCSGWDSLVSLSQNENFGAHNSFAGPNFPFTSENQTINSTSHLVHYRSDSGLGGMMPKLSCFGSGSYSEMVTSFGLADRGQTSYSLSKGGAEKANLAGRYSQEDCRNADDEGSPGGNKKRSTESNSPFDPYKNEAQQQDPSTISLQQDEKKQKIEKNSTLSSRGKQTGKQTKENSDSGDAAKEDYVHVRARRGQATNSHSLAERVRREKISERMRLLQELVPGCNKITGKAVMLDEIINYVQSLQQQVEILSMKLATVNPDVNIDIERHLSKDILNARTSNAAIGYQGLRPTHPFVHGSLPSISSTTMYHSMPQALWDNDLHNLLQMGLDTNNNLGPTGRLKLDLEIETTKEKGTL